MPSNKQRISASEREVLEILWTIQKPLTASEIIKASTNKSWKDSYIHLLIQSLLKKNLIEVAEFKRTVKNYARAFAPTMPKNQLLIQEMLKDYPMDEPSIMILMKHILSQVEDKKIIESMIQICEEHKR